MQCRECGASIASNVAFCPNCGVRQSLAAPIPQPIPQPRAPSQNPQPFASAAPASNAAPSPAANPAATPAAMSAQPAHSAPPSRPQAKPIVSQEAAGMAVGQVSAKPGKAALPQAGETFANRYRVEKYLGLGALCNSYLCRDLAAGNQEMVLKVMHARKAAEAGLPESFLFLAESVAKYDHKGIAKIHEAGRFEGSPYYTMEWVGGVPLRLWLMERLNFENRVLPGLGIIVSLLDIFEAIHERGCYGCLKPENVFVTLNGPVVTDFGVVGFLTPQEFEFNSYARRYLPYMAPELRQDWGNLLPHSDFYSIGAILYEILVGRAPAAQLRLPSELSRIFGIEADEIILKSMAARPLDRFATVEAFKQAVLALQASLLNARPQEEIPGLPPAAPAPASPFIKPRAHTSLDVTSDMQTVHNPDEAFADPETGTFAVPGTAAFKAAPAPTDNPWSAEPPISRNGSETGGGSFDGGGEDAGARTVFYPKPQEEESEKALSAFSRLGDRLQEEAHAQRRFAHAPQPGAGAPEGAAISDSAPTQAWEKPSGGISDGEMTVPEEEEAAPVPAWLWISIALAGSCMVVLSAYFGLLHGN